MESYQTWLGEGPGLSVLRFLGLFDRPADEKALGALLKAPPIPGSRRGADSHCRGPALYPHAGRAIFSGYATDSVFRRIAFVLVLVLELDV
jgi:hypothetical protein